MEHVDVIIVGAGVVGLAVAAELSQSLSDQEIMLMDRHPKFGQDTSSRNSEVIHAGMYYPPNTLKAKLCVEGNPLLYEFCDRFHVPYERLGKLIIAREGNEISAVEGIYIQGVANQVPGLKMLDRNEIATMEPNVTAVAALYSPTTGIIDSHKLMAQLERSAVSNGAMMAYMHKVIGVNRSADGYEVKFIGPDGQEDELACTWLINCAGLYSDFIPAQLGIDVEAAGYKIYPVKGEYFSVAMSKSKLIAHLIYPPPLKSLKGLGTHITKSLDGRARLGPNVQYVSDREDYDVDPAHIDEFYQAARSYLPFIEKDDLQSDMAGMRPKIQAPDAPVADFVICHETDRGLAGFINLVGIESPGLTSCLSIAKMVKEMVVADKK
ncbi:MAG: NAD(P)/FAD-dependent oxidoreductase [Negativicutes bacterium]